MVSPDDRLHDRVVKGGAKLGQCGGAIIGHLGKGLTSLRGRDCNGDRSRKGLRAPLTPDGKAVILAYDFDPKKAPVDVTPHVHLVDLAGLGVRGLDWDSQHDRLLIAAGASRDGETGLAQAGLVAYDLESSDPKLLQSFAGYDGEPEAVSRTPSGRLLVLFDGKVAADRGGVYVRE